MLRKQPAATAGIGCAGVALHTKEKSLGEREDTLTFSSWRSFTSLPKRSSSSEILPDSVLDDESDSVTDSVDDDWESSLSHAFRCTAAFLCLGCCPSGSCLSVVFVSVSPDGESSCTLPVASSLLHSFGSPLSLASSARTMRCSWSVTSLTST